jgi:hypothetical protein
MQRTSTAAKPSVEGISRNQSRNRVAERGCFFSKTRITAREARDTNKLKTAFTRKKAAKQMHRSRKT